MKPKHNISPQSAPLVELVDLTKRFGKVVANDHINLSLFPGQIKALLGENGAGKSTMMSMLAGQYRPDEGYIKIHGKKIILNSPKDALKAGIGMVYQHFMLIDSMTVAQNVLLGQKDSFFIQPQKQEQQVSKIAEQYGLEINPSAYIRNLSMGEKQRVEILKLLYRKSEILIFDEPTAVLTPEETTKLFEAIWKMAELGKSIVFISHKLEEVITLADEIAILRQGKIEGEIDPDSITSKADLAQRMVGREVILEINRFPIQPGDEVLKIKNLNTAELCNINFSIRQGEILALVGVAGNGQKPLIETICGFQKPPADTIFINRKPWQKFFSETDWKHSLSYIPEDRLGLATLKNHNLIDNLLLTTRKGFVFGPILDKKKAAKKAQDLIDRFDIRPPQITALAWQLSGGNLQKTVLARELFREPVLIVAEQPTQGLDVSATEDVWKRLLEVRQIAGVLLVTGDLNEALQLADKIAVMYRGRILAILSVDDKTTSSKLGPLMAGLVEEQNQTIE